MQKPTEEMDVKPDPVLNSSRICRFCLSPAGVMSPIFEQGDLNSLPLSSKIMAFISIQVYVNDGLPSLICHRCLYQVEKSYDFKTQCEASDAMLRKYLSAFQESRSPRGVLGVENSENFVPSFDTVNLAQFQKSLLHNSSLSDSPFKRKRGRPRKEENMMFYSSPLHSHMDFANGIQNYQDDEIKIVDGIESVVTVVDPRSEILSNSDDENKLEIDIPGDSEENDKVKKTGSGSSNSVAIAKAKAKKYMGVVVGVDENGVKTRRHLCKSCGKTFGHCSDLRKHILVHTGERPFHCRICTKTFSRSTNLNKHMKVHTGQKSHFCTNCPKSFGSKGDLQRHSVIHSGLKPFGCFQCNQFFARKDKLTRHMKLHESGFTKTVLKCSLCPALYTSKEDYKDHMESMHPKEEKNEEEEDDDEENKSSGGDVSATKEKLEKEDDSSNDKETKSKEDKEDSPLHDSEDNPEVESMVINIDPFQVDSDVNDSTWENDKGKNEFKTKGTDSGPENDENKTANFFIKTDVNGKSTFQCIVCYKKFSEQSYLKSHMLTHSTVKPHKCSTCDKSFTRRRELLRHENVHTGFKPFKCTTCGKAFSRKDKLVRHEKIHNGIKKLPCSICPSLFFGKVEDLLYHHRSAHPDTKLPYVLPTNLQSGIKYQCDTCLICFGNLKLYQDHLKTHDEKNSSQEKVNGIEEGSENGNSDKESVKNSSLEQLNSNPAITVTSISKSSAR